VREAPGIATTRRQAATERRADLERTAAFRTQLRHYLGKTKAVTSGAGLTPERYDLLLMVEVASDSAEGATVSGLCHRLQLRQTAVTELVKRAEEAGLITRERSAADGRVFFLRLTDEGEERLLRVFDALRGERAAFVESFRLVGESFHA
jgi:DNA-binding MarR family transcriptional regulator